MKEEQVSSRLHTLKIRFLSRYLAGLRSNLRILEMQLSACEKTLGETLSDISLAENTGIEPDAPTTILRSSEPRRACEVLTFPKAKE